MDRHTRNLEDMQISGRPSDASSSVSRSLVRAASLAVASGVPLISDSVARKRAASSTKASVSVGGMVGSSSTTKSTMNAFESGLQDERQMNAKRFSVSTLWSMASEHDLDIEDSLTARQKRLKELKSKISSQSKRNFLLERDVRYLDSRIALLIQNRMALDEEMLLGDDDRNDVIDHSLFPDDRKKQLYGNLFFLLQTEPRIVSHLVRLITLSEIDTLLQTVMFTLYGNQYDSREEHLLLTMFQSVLQTQFDNTSDFGSLLRANTPVSRMMTTYTRRGPGQQYLKFVLTENVNKVVSMHDENLEINPLKIYEQIFNQLEASTGQTPDMPRSVTAEEAFESELVQELLRPRVQKLIQLANMFLKTIIDSIDEVPYGIRWICKQIKLLTREKFPDVSNWSICSLIGGFFFLRFINPAIVTPQSYMIIDGQPSKDPRRTFTLLAKMLQNLANKPSYAKEAYMSELNPFIEDNKDRIMEFLDRLCDVSDFYESLELDQYMALSKKDISISITLNEIYNTHSLLYQHINEISKPLEGSVSNGQRVFSKIEQSQELSCGHLKSLLSDLGPSPAQLSRADNRALNLPLFSKWENPAILFSNLSDSTHSTTTSTGLTDADILYMDTKSLLVQILRKQAISLDSSAYTNHIYSPGVTVDQVPDFNESLLDIEEILSKGSSQSKDSATVKRSLRARQNLRILEDRYKHPLIKKSMKYSAFAEEVHSEFVHLQSLNAKSVNEIRSLELVYKTICDHNQYLRSQLESYRAYLQNVRIQASGKSAKNTMLGVTSGSSMSTKLQSKKGSSKRSHAVTGPIKFTHSQLEKEGVIIESGVPDNRRANIYFSIESPMPGSFMIGLHYKGREKPIVEVDVKLDDLLEKQQDNVQHLDLEYVQLNVNKTLYVLNKHFIKK